MSGPVDNMFCVMRVINASNEPMTPRQIADKTFLNVRTVQRHAIRLASEGLIEFKHRKNGFLFMRRGLRV
ncbi:hypothetical protein [Psychrobacter sp.]|uniref:hypothetical protein n=1 Tax=Psychrobacter sp. TaxID=56811 RepID=UPI003BAE1AF5